jgi:hypothetical protein
MNKLCCEYITCTRGLLHFKVVHLYSNQIWQNGNTGVGLPNTTVYCSAIYWRPLAEIRHGNSDTLRPAHQSPLLESTHLVIGSAQVDFGTHCKLEFGSFVQTIVTTTNTEYPWDDDKDNADMMIERSINVDINDNQPE